MVYDFSLESSTWWSVCILVANSVLLGRRGYVQYVEESRSASQRFALRSKTLPYITVWAIFSIAAIFFAYRADDFGEALGVTGLIAAEFVAVCLWGHYYGNLKLLMAVVDEVNKRSRNLLTQGLGMCNMERVQYCTAAENAIVEMWTKQLREQKWKSFATEQLNKLLFDTGVKCGVVMSASLWEGVLPDVAAHSKEWRLAIRNIRPTLRIPIRVKQALRLGSDSSSQALLFVGVVIANEDKDLRDFRSTVDSLTCKQQFSAARIAKRKTAGEGILRWPDCLSPASVVNITEIEYDTSSLKIEHNGTLVPCPNVSSIPDSILYTISEVLKAGYIKIKDDSMIDCTVRFDYGSMIFNKEDWNQSRAVERSPFRFITSATRLQGNAAFMVEKREVTGSQFVAEGSAFLNGPLQITARAQEEKESHSWVGDAVIPGKNESIWGDIPSDLVKPSRQIHLLNLPTVLLIRVAWALVDTIVKVRQTIEAMWKRRQVPTPPNSFWATAERLQLGSAGFLTSLAQQDHESRRNEATDCACEEAPHEIRLSTLSFSRQAEEPVPSETSPEV